MAIIVNKIQSTPYKPNQNVFETRYLVVASIFDYLPAFCAQLVLVQPNCKWLKM